MRLTRASSGPLAPSILYPAITNRINTTVTAQGGNVTRVIKSAGGDGGFNASAVSALVLTGDFTLKMTGVTNVSSNVYGVNADPLTDDSYPGIDYAWNNNANAWIMYRNAAFSGIIVTGGTVWIWRRAGIVYMGHGATFAAAAAAPDFSQADTNTFAFDCTIQNVNDGVDVVLSIP